MIETSSRDDVAAVDAVAGKAMDHSEVASEAHIVAEAPNNTSVGFAVIAMLADHTCGADHGQKEKQQTRESSIGGYGMRSEDMVARTSARQP